MKLNIIKLFLLVVIFLSATAFVMAQIREPESGSRSGNVRITTFETDYGSQALKTLLVNNDPTVYVNYYNSSNNNKNKIDNLRIDLYRAQTGDLLEYLLYEKGENNLIEYQTIETDNLQFVTVIEKNDYLLDGIPLPILDEGFYLVRATVNNSEFNDLIILKTDLGSVLKESKEGYVIWAQRVLSGLRNNGGIVEGYNLENKAKKLFTTNLDSDGLGKINYHDSDLDILVVKTNDERTAVVPVNYPEYGYRYDYGYANYDYSVIKKHYLFTDRPIYKPGDKVYFKTIIRNDDDSVYSIPTGEAKVELRNYGQEDPVSVGTYSINQFGTVAGEFTLPEKSDNPYYYLEISPVGDDTYWNTQTAYITVEHYRKPEYFLETSVNEIEVVKGDDVNFGINGNYFFGEPLENQNVKASVTRQYPYESLKYTDLVLDKDGNANLKFNTGSIDFNQENVYYYETDGRKQSTVELSASFNDESGNRTESHINTIVYESETRVLKESGSYSSPTNSNVNTELGFYINNEPLSEINTHIEINRHNWERVQNPNRTEKWSPEYVYNEIITKVDERNLKTDQDGKLSINFVPKFAGTYKINLSYTDNRNNEIKKEYSVWVYDGANYAMPSEGYENNIILSKDQEKYEPGEIVNLLIQTLRPGRDALLTIERGRTRDYRVINLKDSINTVQIPTPNSYLPNIFANVSSFFDSGFQSNTEDIEFNIDSKKIKVELNFESDNFGPGENIELQVKTTDTLGKPVSSEVTIWSVDKAIYELMKSSRRDIVESFWGTKYNGTNTYHSLVDIRTSGGAEKGGGGDDNVRDAFSDMAYWNPSVITDSNGIANLDITLPDNLTTWVFDSVAVTRDTMVGEFSKEIVVSKPLIVRPILPNYLRVGDTFELSTLVHNYTGSDRELNVQCDLGEHGKILNEKKYSVLNGKIEKTIWPIGEIVNADPDSLISCKAYSQAQEEFADAIEQKLPIYEFSFSQKDAEVGVGEKVFKIDLTEDTNIEKSTFELSLAPSIIGTLPEAMEYLVDYPYGCNEQITSKLAPSIIARENFGIYSEYIKDKKIDEIISEGIEKIESAMAYNGWSWWGQGERNPFVTAYITEYLVRAKNLGYKVNQYKLDQVKNWAQSLYDTESGQAKVAGAYILKTLNPAGNYFVTDINNLTPDLLSMAVIVNYKSGNINSATNGLNRLLEMSENGEDIMWWGEGSKEFFGSKDASTAMALKALVTVGDKNNADKAARYLSKNKNNRYWSNTFATAQTIDALTKYSLKNSGTNPNLDYAVKINDKEYSTGHFGKITDVANIVIPSSDIKNGDTVAIEFDGQGTIYSTLVIDEYRDSRDAEAQSNGLTVSRKYVGRLTPGETIDVEITVEGIPDHSSNQMVIQDHLPAGLVPVSTILENERDAQNYYNFSNYNVTEDGVVFGYQYREPGINTIVAKYKARVISRGTYFAPPATAALMYLPEVNGHSAVDVVKVDGSYLDKGFNIPGLDLSRNIVILIIILIILGLSSAAYIVYLKKQNKLKNGL